MPLTLSLGRCVESILYNRGLSAPVSRVVCGKRGLCEREVVCEKRGLCEKRPIFSPLARTHEQRPMPLQQLDVGLFKHSKVDCQISNMISNIQNSASRILNMISRQGVVATHQSSSQCVKLFLNFLRYTEDTYTFYILKICGNRSYLITSSCFSSRSSVSFLQISNI
jgi:hypothetical protein